MTLREKLDAERARRMAEPEIREALTETWRNSTGRALPPRSGLAILSPTSCCPTPRAASSRATTCSQRAVLRHAGSGPEEVAALVDPWPRRRPGAGRRAGPAGTLALPRVEPEVSHPMVLAAAAGRPMNRAVGAFVKLARAGAWDATA